MAHIQRSALAIVLLGVWGCAQGGGGRTGDTDAGPRLDSDGIRLFDSGTPENDSGIPGVDAGPIPPGVDAGPRIDAGPGPVDAGYDAGMTSTCSESPCRLVEPQCGCPSGQGCYLNATDDRTCGTLGSGLEGDICSGASDCSAGNQCLGVGYGSLCFHYCEDDADCTSGPGSVCFLEVADSTGTPLGVKACTHDCDPAYDVGCDALGSGCTIGLIAGRDPFTLCRPAGTGLQGDPCLNEEDCFGGHLCNAGRCRQYCTSSFDCFIGGCYPFSPAIFIGATQYGYCN